MNEIECPYCNKEVEEPDEAYEEDCRYELECNECQKTFQVSPYYIKGYHVIPTPCLNGEPHKYKPIKGYPTEFFENKVRCNDCEAESTKV